jgi:dTDP-D-glucose 4,6-dehydratase
MTSGRMHMYKKESHGIWYKQHYAIDATEFDWQPDETFETGIRKIVERCLSTSARASNKW